MSAVGTTVIASILAAVITGVILEQNKREEFKKFVAECVGYAKRAIDYLRNRSLRE